jgi:hypothetical protein
MAGCFIIRHKVADVLSRHFPANFKILEGVNFYAGLSGYVAGMVFKKKNWLIHVREKKCIAS